ncbi:MAG: MnhB domain-containing protein [Actinomycetota bacterium]
MRFERSVILSASVDLVFHTAMVFSLFLLFAGHNAPGGGFVGGLVAGAAFVLRYLDAGPAAVGDRGKGPAALLGLGVGTAILSGATGWVFGGAFLESVDTVTRLPLLGSLKTNSALLFDIGVYLIVVGLVQTVLSVLGDPE